MAYENVRALRLLKLNIKEVLAKRGLSPSEFARRLRADTSTVSKMLNERLNLNIQMEWLDKFHEVLGLEPHQLFSPGLGELTERRSNRERRSASDRRADWPIKTMREVPRTKEALSPRLIELVELGEKLTGEYYDHWLRVGKAQLVRQGLQQPLARPVDPVRTAEKPGAQSGARRKKRKHV